MSRIDVLPSEKNHFKVLVNFVQRGVSYSTAAHANKEAQSVCNSMVNVELHLAKI